MLRLFSCVLSSCFLLGASALFGGVQHATDADFGQLISKGVVVVDLYADWCGPCKVFAPTFEAVATQLDGKATFLKVNIDKAPNLTRQYKVSSIPTVLLFKDGKEVNRRQGGFSQSDFKTFVEGAIGSK